VSGFVLLAALPAIYWAQPIDTAPAVRRAGIQRLAVPPEAAAAWRDAGFIVAPLGQRERSERTDLRAPGLSSFAERASATQRPWLVANGWRFLRAPAGRFWCDVPAGKAALAAAEAFAYGADEVLAIDPADLDAVGRMLAFLSSIPGTELPVAADLAIVDDGSAVVAEVLNLMARRNLLFRVTRDVMANIPLNVRIGSKEFPRKAAQDPEAFALSVRRQLTDERRSLRLFGSDVVLARLGRDASRAHLHLLNYGGRTIEGLRVRLLGSWVPAEAYVFGEDCTAIEDVVTAGGATELSLSTLGPYAVVDLTAAAGRPGDRCRSCCRSGHLARPRPDARRRSSSDLSAPAPSHCVLERDGPAERCPARLPDGMVGRLECRASLQRGHRPKPVR
jgi:hypothetical protein